MGEIREHPTNTLVYTFINAQVGWQTKVAARIEAAAEFGHAMSHATDRVSLFSVEGTVAVITGGGRYVSQYKFLNLLGFVF